MIPYVDSTINDQGRHGYYSVDNLLFRYKSNALTYASRTNQNVGWDFNYNVFEAQAAKPRLNIPLKELYRQRAQQIRDTYDYVILSYSGGSDSDTILKAFVDNNIPLDEVNYYYPKTLVDKSNYQLNLSTDNTNMVSEYFLVVKPSLDQLAITNPKINIQIEDIAESLVYIEDQQDMLVTNIPMHYYNMSRHMKLRDKVTKLQDSYKKVCVIHGVDKVIPYVNKKKFGFTFVDNATAIKHDFMEFFFWTPDMPEIVTEQAHLVWDGIRENARPFVEYKQANDPLTNWMRRGALDSMIKSIIYPEWDQTKHQVNKTSIMIGEAFGKFYSPYIKSQQALQSWASSFHSVIKEWNTELAFNDGKSYLSDIRSHRNFHFIGEL
jgi:hypothetical protein